MVAAIVVLGVTLGGGTGEGPTDPEDCPPRRATQFCDPTVGPGQDVQIGGVRWRLEDVETRSAIDGESPLDRLSRRAEAKGVFLGVRLRATSTSAEPAQVGYDTVQLQSSTEIEDADSTAGFAGDYAGRPNLDRADDGRTIDGWVFFDVPRRALREDIKLRINEYPTGDTRGFIRVPRE